MSIKLKVCGLKDSDNIKGLLSTVQPDFIGLITYDKSPRYMLNTLNDVDFVTSTKKVGVFVNTEVNMVLKTIAQYKLDAVQLHGGESVEYCEQFKKHDVKVIKVFSVLDELPHEKMAQYVSSVDYFLLDTKTPMHGGSGRKFDWKILDDYTYDIPFFLSGGIDADDAEAINNLAISQLYALDINSKFEVAPGIKDINKIKEFKERLV